MKKKRKKLIFVSICFLLSGGWFLYSQNSQGEDSVELIDEKTKERNEIFVSPAMTLHQLKDDLSVIRYDDDYGFQRFLDMGGASSDQEVLQYLMDHELSGVSGLQFLDNLFGCSTLQSINEQQEILFGRNFDWQPSQALIIESDSEDAYASISTVNLDFIQSGTSMSLHQLPDDVLAKVAMYAPLDGMNEKGLVVSVNMIQDAEIIEQHGKSQDLTTTTAIRLLLNQAADVEEAIALLAAYDLHSSMGMMIHFAIADAKGNSVVAEYVNNEMKIIETPVVTNFYLSQGEKHNIGTAQSHERYDILMEQLRSHETMNMNQMKDALDLVSKDNFGEFESTEWSIVYNLHTLEVHYYHQEDYKHRYRFDISQ